LIPCHPQTTQEMEVGRSWVQGQPRPTQWDSVSKTKYKTKGLAVWHMPSMQRLWVPFPASQKQNRTKNLTGWKLLDQKVHFRAFNPCCWMPWEQKYHLYTYGGLWPQCSETHFYLVGLVFELRTLCLQSSTLPLESSSPFCSGYFGHGVSRTIFPGWPQISVLPISASQLNPPS
jgi:hypothetical protein